MLEEEKTIFNDFGYCCYIFDISKKQYIIYNLYIWPEFRRQGNGKKILQSVINKIKETGYNDNIMIESIPMENSISLEKLVSFYENMGLTVI